MTNINQDKEEYAKAAMRHLHEEQLKRVIKDPLEDTIAPLQRGDIVADIGSGGGYYTLRFAREVGPEGHVYAIDVDPENLAFVAARAKNAGLNERITLVWTGEDSSAPRDSCVDLAFLRSTFHHLDDPVRYFTSLKPALMRLL